MTEIRSKKLRRESALFRFLGQSRTSFFRHLCDEALSDERARDEHEIFRTGEACSSARCISTGQAVYNMECWNGPDGEEIPIGKDRQQTVSEGTWISEVVLWTSWQHTGNLTAMRDCSLLNLPVKDFEHLVQLYPEVYFVATIYAHRLTTHLKERGASDILFHVSSDVWEEDSDDLPFLDESEAGAEASGVLLPWQDSLPAHVDADVAEACLIMAQRIASRGLDENRAHHGFTIIIGNSEALDSCGRAGFNPFAGHSLNVVNAEGDLDEGVFDTLRRNAFNADGAIVIDGATGVVVASGWFVNDISEGGYSGGARTRSARAVARQAGDCYVIKASEDSRGEVALHLGERTIPSFNEPLIDKEQRGSPWQSTGGHRRSML